MRTKILLFFVIFASVMNACKEEKPAPVIPKEPINITAEGFALLAAKAVDKQGLNEGSSRFILVKGYNITDIDADGAKVRHFPKIWEYESLKPILIKYPLSLQNICEKSSSMQIDKLKVFLNDFSSKDGLFKVEPRPKYLITVGNEVFLVGYGLKLWKTREQVALER
jgi:hypothetical protein